MADRRVGGQGLPARRNIRLTRELIMMGVTELVVQDYNLMMQIRPNSAEERGLLVFSKYDLKDLKRNERTLESTLAGYVGKGVPQNFDIKACSAAVTIALWNDCEEQYQQLQRSVEEQKQEEKSILDEINNLREDNPNLSFNEWQKILLVKYLNLKHMVKLKLPEIWPGLEFGLSLLRILNIEDCTLPLIGILLGRPGSGKTVAIMLLSKWIYTCYEDSFTKNSWVTHTTSVNSEEELRLMDLLGMIKDKQFLTPELATVFNLKEDELRLELNNIIRIADGHGFSKHSGAHGHRGYGDTMFTWLGAIVDIPHQVYKVLGNLGPKLYFFRLPFKETSDAQILKYITNQEDFNIAYQTVEAALFDYLTWFEIGPTLSFRSPDSPNLVKMVWNKSKIETDAYECIVQLAKLLGYLRREGAAYIPEYISSVADSEDEGYKWFAGPKEDVKRCATVLTNLARGHALITGRNYITIDDIPIVVKTVLSTARIERVKSFIALLDNDGCIRTSELAEQLKISRSTAYRFMIELKAIELVDVKLTNDIEFTNNNNPAQVKVMTLRNDEFGWFLSEDFKKLRAGFTPVDNRQHMNEEDAEKQAVKEAIRQ